MKYHRVPYKLRVKVRDYFYHKFHGRLFNEAFTLKELSHVLEEVMAHELSHLSSSICHLVIYLVFISATNEKVNTHSLFFVCGLKFYIGAISN